MNDTSPLTKFKIMAIVNMTPDSFSGDGLYNQPRHLRRTLEAHISQGADLIDIGAESTRPGASPITATEEIRRLQPALDIMQRYDIPFSIDTHKAEVMEHALAHGASYLNDTRALQTPKTLEIAAKSDAKVILMHMQGQPTHMQNNPQYTSVVTEIIDFFNSRISACIQAGINTKRIILDPGFGFGKTTTHNYTLLANLKTISDLGFPILTGISRKSMLNEALECQPEQRDLLTCGADIAAILAGASIIRTHSPSLLNQMRLVWKTTGAYA